VNTDMCFRFRVSQGEIAPHQRRVVSYYILLHSTSRISLISSFLFCLHYHLLSHTDLVLRGLSSTSIAYPMTMLPERNDASTNDVSRPGESDSGASSPVVIFLDVDGVLLPFGDAPRSATISSQTEGSIFPDSCLSAFSTILSAFHNPRVVLSSTWRVRKEFCDQIIDSLQAFGRKFGGPLENIRFYDTTDPTIHSTRQAEIDAWLQANEYRRAWIALDDEELVDGPENRSRRIAFLNKAVRTRSHIGLTSEDAHHAVSLLCEQLDAPFVKEESTTGSCCEKQELPDWQCMADAL
jgi:HAD domain in Swiss Army Knife RNA repair proteins